MVAQGEEVGEERDGLWFVMRASDEMRELRGENIAWRGGFTHMECAIVEA